MILILKNNDDFANEFTRYLIKVKSDFMALTIKDFLSANIIDCYPANITERILVSNGKSIKLDKIRGIYHDFCYFDKNLFNNFVESDRLYALKEYYAYLMFFINIIPNKVNPLSWEQLGGSYLSIPYNFEVARNVGFAIPDYKFCHEISESDISKSIFYKNTSNPYDSFIPTETEPAMLQITRPKGIPLIHHIIGDTIFSTLIKGDKKFSIEISNNHYLQLMEFKKQYNISVLEILTFKHLDELIFYSASPSPNWSQSSYSLDRIWETLLCFLNQQGDINR